MTRAASWSRSGGRAADGRKLIDQGLCYRRKSVYISTRPCTNLWDEVALILLNFHQLTLCPVRLNQDTIGKGKEREDLEVPFKYKIFVPLSQHAVLVISWGNLHDVSSLQGGMNKCSFGGYHVHHAPNADQFRNGLRPVLVLIVEENSSVQNEKYSTPCL